ncbi:MAG: DEAD/DEAH box helicase [Gemmatimonadota bacterium]|nr:DEAD/DEAH box helicase [Gemmatimonadota bacterium]
MEQEGTPTAGVARGQNTVFVLPPDWAHAASFLAPAIERLDPAGAAPQMLVVAPDPDVATILAAAALALARPAGLSATAATSARRAARALRERASAIVVGDAPTIVALLRASALKLDGVRQLVLAWLDDQLAAHEGALEVVLAEVPKDAARTIVARELSPAVEALIERYARRPRRVLPPAPAGEAHAAPPVQFVTAHGALRSAALRRLLDELDPATAFVFARERAARDEVSALLDVLGYPEAGPVRVGTAIETDADTLVLYDLPATRADLQAIIGERRPSRIVALVQPRQLAALREVAGGPVSPFLLPEPVQRARAAEDRLRDELRATLLAGGHAREVLALEPLLGEFDGVEIAAAALSLLEGERHRPAAVAGASAAPAGATARMTRLFMNVGEMDGVRPADLVGAITAHGGLTGAEVGRVEIRERHALVEVPEAAASSVAERLTGRTIRGRQIHARLESDRPARPPRSTRPMGPRRSGDSRR